MTNGDAAAAAACLQTPKTVPIAARLGTRRRRATALGRGEPYLVCSVEEPNLLRVVVDASLSLSLGSCRWMAG